MTDSTARPDEGAVLNMIFAVGVVQFTDCTNPAGVWTLPLIGYAVYVTWCDFANHDGYEYGTAITPVVLFEGGPVMVYDLTRKEGEYPGCPWEVIPA